MEEHFTGLRAIRDKIRPGPGTQEAAAARKQAEIDDLKLCLTGNPASERWQLLKMELANKDQELLCMKRRLAGRTPMMESWADPLPG